MVVFVDDVTQFDDWYIHHIILDLYFRPRYLVRGIIWATTTLVY